MDDKSSTGAAEGATGVATVCATSANPNDMVRKGQPEPEAGAAHPIPAVAPPTPHWPVATVSPIPPAAAVWPWNPAEAVAAAAAAAAAHAQGAADPSSPSSPSAEDLLPGAHDTRATAAIHRHYGSGFLTGPLATTTASAASAGYRRPPGKRRLSEIGETHSPPAAKAARGSRTAVSDGEGDYDTDSKGDAAEDTSDGGEDARAPGPPGSRRHPQRRRGSAGTAGAAPRRPRPRPRPGGPGRG